MIKRVFDIVAATLGLVALSVPFLVIGLLIKLNSPGPVLFKQRRVGRRFRPFLICKFRTMASQTPGGGSQITAGRDPRITPIGHLLRRTKIDELPQLFNVLKGEMSLVGPRPEVPRYVEMFRRDYEEILVARPGITDLASIRYSDEAAVLGKAEKPEEEYVRRLLPEKIELAKQYITRSSLLFDLALIARTLLKLLGIKGTVVPPTSPCHIAKNH